MLLAASSNYPVLDLFWTIIEFFLWVIWIWILIMIFIDIFRSHDLSGWAKALWFLFVLFIPLIGVLVYLIVRGGSMHERQVRQAQRDADAFYASGRHAAAPSAGDGRRRQHRRPAGQAGRPARPGRAHPGGIRKGKGQGSRGLRAAGRRGAGAGHRARPSSVPAARA